MTVPRLLTQGRVLAGRLFADTCSIRRQTGTMFDEETGQTVPTFTSVYEGECLTRPLGAAEQVAGEQQVNLRGYSVFLPWDQTEPRSGDQIVVVASHDGYLNGRVLDVLNVAADTINYWRRLDCEENQTHEVDGEDPDGSDSGGSSS